MYAEDLNEYIQPKPVVPLWIQLPIKYLGLNILLTPHHNMYKIGRVTS